MEESISILEENPQTELQVQQPVQTDRNLTRLIETENRLNQVFEEYTGRIESFMLMLNSLKEAVFLVNTAGDICYANEPGNAFIKALGNTLPDYLGYRPLANEGLITITNDALPDTRIRASNFLWNGEQCNLFSIEKVEIIREVVTEVIKEEVVVVQSTSTLNEPFASLMSYIYLIADHEAGGRTAEAESCAAMAGKTVLQSEKFLADIKAYMRLAGTKPVLTQVSMQKIAGDVLKSMGSEIEDAEIEVSVSELPDQIADKDMITILLKHLVGNAVKFRNKSRKAMIDIGHDKSDGQFIFCVRDNGIGISKKHHEEVFNLFQTLNDTNEYPGNGMGLAICKKIVDMHNGKIWVESLPGHGSNFYFKLNARQ